MKTGDGKLNICSRRGLTAFGERDKSFKYKPGGLGYGI